MWNWRFRRGRYGGSRKTAGFGPGVIHGNTGKASKNQLSEAIISSAKEFLLAPLHHDFGATLATENKENGIAISKRRSGNLNFTWFAEAKKA